MVFFVMMSYWGNRSCNGYNRDDSLSYSHLHRIASWVLGEQDN